MAAKIKNHRHRLRLEAAGEKGYTFRCVRRGCRGRRSISKKLFWTGEVNSIFDHIGEEQQPVMLGDRMGGRSAPLIGSHHLHPGVDKITNAGILLAEKHLREILGKDHELFQHPFITQTFLDMLAEDWMKGREHQVFNALGRYLDLTGAYRVVAAMVGGSRDQMEVTG